MRGVQDQETFEQFWREYLEAHKHPATRGIHIAGTAAALLGIALSIVTFDPTFLVGGIILAYAAAWLSHAFVERNAPKTFSHPAWSLRADLRMLALATRGQLQAEMERHAIQSARD